MHRPSLAAMAGDDFTAGERRASASSATAVGVICLAVLLVTGAIEWTMGRSPLGPDGRIGLWEGTIWSNECSQRVADPYSFSHIAHGVLFYFGLWLVGKGWPVRCRFLAALLIEACWEILENSPVIIDRYRQTAIALGYNGDSVLNSLSDIVMMVIGFVVAARVRPWKSVALVVLMELGCAYWIRDNLTLNVIMLIHPIERVERWQAASKPAAAPMKPVPETPGAKAGPASR